MENILKELSQSEDHYHQGLKKTAAFIKTILESREEIEAEIGENFDILDTTFKDYNEILKFHNNFSIQLQKRTSQPQELLELFQVNTAKMKTKYAQYAYTLKWSLHIARDDGNKI